MTFPNIIHEHDVSKTVSTGDSYYDKISYFKTLEDFMDYESYSKFIKEIERMVRTSDDYKKFCAYIRNVIGVNFCQVFSDLNDFDVTLELHHGPTFTLYDICEVILQWFIKNKQRINTFRVAKKVLEEHLAMRVGVISLSKTAHEMAHNNDLILNVNQCIGNTDAFIKLYKDYLTDEQKYKLWTYVNMCKTNPSFDRGILDLDYIVKYVKPND